MCVYHLAEYIYISAVYRYICLLHVHICTYIHVHTRMRALHESICAPVDGANFQKAGYQRGRNKQYLGLAVFKGFFFDKSMANFIAVSSITHHLCVNKS